jgi:hypothetical protein
LRLIFGLLPRLLVAETLFLRAAFERARLTIGPHSFSTSEALQSPKKPNGREFLAYYANILEALRSICQPVMSFSPTIKLGWSNSLSALAATKMPAKFLERDFAW